MTASPRASAPDHFLMTTTTGNAAPVLAWLEDYLQTEWPNLRVYLTSVTEHWATASIVGPKSRELLAELAPGTGPLARGVPVHDDEGGDRGGTARARFSASASQENCPTKSTFPLMPAFTSGRRS